MRALGLFESLRMRRPMRLCDWNVCVARNLVLLILGSSVVGVFPVFEAVAQAPGNLEAIERPSERPFSAPDRSDVDPLIEVLPAIPDAAEGTDRDRRDSDHIRVQRIVFRGNSALETAELMAVAEPFLNRDLNGAGVEALRRRLTKAYVDAGYVNSGALIPRQDASDGTLLVDVLEGQVVEVRLSGLRHYRESVIRQRIVDRLGTPFRIDELENQLRILNQDPRIDQIAARLLPGPSRHEAILEVSIRESDPRRLKFQADNHESPSGGAFAGRLGIGHANAFGLGDEFRLDVSRTEGLTRLSGRYALPLSFARLPTSHLFFEGSLGIAELVENSLRRLEIETESSGLMLGYGQTLYESARDRVDVSIGFERRRSKTSLLGRGFSFGEGPENGRTEISVIRATGEWTHRGRSSVFAFRSLFNFGVDLFSPTVRRGEQPDSVFFSWLGQVRGTYRFPTSGIELRLRGDLQLADRPLLSLEQFSVGGAGSVRGYRRNQLVRDQGFSAALDVQIPLWRSGDGRTLFSAGPFADVGRSWNRDRVTPGIRTLSSLGAGFEWSPLENLNFDLEYAYPIRDAGTSGDLQDESVYFRAVWWAL